MTPIIGGLLEAGLKIIDKVLPDAQAKAAAQIELMRLQQAGEFKQIETDLQLSLGQIEVNKAEAESGSLFKGGWRPAVGWICAFALGYQMIARPLLAWVSNIYAWLPPPSLELDTLLTLLFGMLGLGAMRTTERLKGVAKG